MLRTRLALFTLALGLASASGCGFTRSCCQVTTPHTDCACNENPYVGIGAGVAGFEPGLESGGFEGPVLMQPDGGYMPPMPTPNEPPRIVPVPQANPIPYTPPTTPTGLRRLFSRD